jgi:hypothetical protein
MFGSMVVATMEMSIINLEACNAIMMQVGKMLHAGQGIQDEANLMRDKFAALQSAFADALSDATDAKIGQDLRSIIRLNYASKISEPEKSRILAPGFS